MMDLVLRFITASLVVSSFVVLSDVLNPRVLRFAPHPPPREVLWRRLQRMFSYSPIANVERHNISHRGNRQQNLGVSPLAQPFPAI